MKGEIERICAKCRPKSRAILRTRGFYCVADLIHQFKTHVWPIPEGSNGAIFHAYDSHISRLDTIQDHFLDKLDMSQKDAFLRYNFAPLASRHIRILGLLFKIALNKCHPGFREFFQSVPVETYLLS